MEIPLVRARYAHAFAKTLDKLGVPTSRLLQAHRLPPELAERQDGLIAAYQLWSFAGDAARREGLSELGLLAGRVPVVEHGEFGKMVYQALTLYDAIRTFCDNARAEYSRADFYFTRDRNQAWFCRGPIDGDSAIQRQQVELYVLIMMIDTIRLGTGSDWAPTRIHLQNEDRVGLADIPLFRNADTRFGCAATAVGIPLEALANPLQGDISAFAKNTADPDDSGILDFDFANSLRRLLQNYLGSMPLTLDVTAEITGITPRTLQRRLSESGMTYQQVIEQLRFETALPMLLDQGLNITAIAFELGYSDSAHFTRAFRRWAGMSPSEYRRRHAA